jgi:hypothetical protein
MASATGIAPRFRRSAHLLDVVDGPDAGVAQRSEQPGLALESRQPLGVGSEVFGQDLESHLAAEPGVFGAKHLAHPPSAKACRDAVV